MVDFLGHGNEIFKIKDLLDHKTNFDDRYGKMKLRYCFLWENFEKSILGLLDLENFDEENPPGFWTNRLFRKIVENLT